MFGINSQQKNMKRPHSFIAILILFFLIAIICIQLFWKQTVYLNGEEAKIGRVGMQKYNPMNYMETPVITQTTV